MNIRNYLSNKREIVEAAFQRYVPRAVTPFENHIEAMRYSLLVGGKRIRPILCLAAGEAVAKSEKTEENLLPVACALECIHTYSLIHDDLPAMDDDELRRGKPTNHTIFGEAGAILAGDSLLTWAFDLLSSPETGTLPPAERLRIIHLIARVSGPLGMVGGQALDIAHENTVFPFETLQTIHENKTGRLITGSILAGAIGAGATSQQIEKLTIFGDSIGLCFQIVDDLLNATATTEQLGKAAGSDADRGKATYPAYFGIDTTRQKARAAVDEAVSALADFDNNADPLRGIAEYVYTRSH